MLTPLILTHSDIQEYLHCRRVFRWSVLDDWNQPDKVNGPFALGTRVHAAIEQFHRWGVDPVDAHTDLAQKARSSVGPDAPTWLTDQLESDILMGTNCVMGYRRWVRDTGPYDGWNVYEVERTVETPLLSGQVILRGKIDLVLENSNDQFMIEDFKTLAPTRVESAQNVVLRTFQHAIYAHTLAAQDEIEVIKARYVHMKKLKDPSRAKDPVFVSDVPVLRRSTRVAMAYIERIAEEIMILIGRDTPADWYPHPQDSCSWCPYRNPCLLATDGRGAENEALANQFQHGLRLSRYDHS